MLRTAPASVEDFWREKKEKPSVFAKTLYISIGDDLKVLFWKYNNKSRNIRDISALNLGVCLDIVAAEFGKRDCLLVCCLFVRIQGFWYTIHPHALVFVNSAASNGLRPPPPSSR